MAVIKHLSIAVLYFLATLPTVGAERPDSEYVFRFPAGKDGFYVPWHGNGIQLDSLIEAVSDSRMPLENGDRYISVSSYGTAAGDSASLHRIARQRRLRVKSELITRCGVTESMFVTDRHCDANYSDTLNNVVVVTFPAPVEKVEAIAGPEAAERVRRYNTPPLPEAENGATETATVAEDPAPNPAILVEDSATIAIEQPESKIVPPSLTGNTANSFAVRANLLRWATLTPDIGFEWHITPSLSVAAHGCWTTWSWNHKDRRYALREIAPEVRWYPGEARRGYIGAMYKAGAFNYKLGHTGHQGNINGGGITGGYVLPLNNRLSLDFSMALGYLHAHYDKYTVIDGVIVRSGSDKKNWFGPINIGVTLTWTIF